MFFSEDSNRNAARSAGDEVRGPKDEMDELRAGIDAVDEEIVRLLDRRARLARGIGEIKQKNGLDAYAPAR
jgi:chorismate mutase